MSGHSKWANIQGTKGAADKKRAVAFSRAARLITVATKEGGGPDPVKNFKLRVAIEKARAVNMPKENIDRAIAKGSGALEAEQLESVMYEALALEGRVGILIECATDNKNRTNGNVRTALTKLGATFAASGAVSWLFDRRGVLRINSYLDEEKQLQLIDVGAVDFTEEDEGTTIYTEPQNFWSVIQRLHEWNLNTVYSELDWVPKNSVSISEEDRIVIEKIITAIENTDEVESVYTNIV